MSRNHLKPIDWQAAAIGSRIAFARIIFAHQTMNAAQMRMYICLGVLEMLAEADKDSQAVSVGEWQKLLKEEL